MRRFKLLFAACTGLPLLAGLPLANAYPALVSTPVYYHQKKESLDNFKLFRLSLTDSKAGCSPGDFTLPVAVSGQARKVADYMSGINLEITDKSMLKGYWDVLDDAQKTFRKATYDPSVSGDDISDQSLLPYLLQKEQPDIYHTFKKAGMPDNTVTDDDIDQWLTNRVQPTVSPKGQIIDCRPYAQMDQGWLLTGINYIGQAVGYLKQADFQHNYKVTTHSGDTLKLVLIGDWGTSTPQAHSVAKWASREEADYVIHLGDIYYSGTSAEIRANYLNAFPTSKSGAFMLNANHEMDGAAIGYFGALQNPRFARQNGTSFFVLEYQDWAIIGLDSAYDADGAQFKKGRVRNSHQINLLQHYYQHTDKKIILMTHHNPVSHTGSKFEPLWKDVTGDPVNAQPDYWYFGHQHLGIFFSSAAAGAPTKLRCSGHSGIPTGKGLEFFDSNGDFLPTISYYAHTPDPLRPDQTTNGYMVITLDGDSLEEMMYDHNHTLQWRTKN